MEAHGNGTVPVENTLEVPVAAPVVEDRAHPPTANFAAPTLPGPPIPTALATATSANLAAAAPVPPVPVAEPVVAPVVARPAVPAVGQGMANLGGFNIGGALGGSNPPSRHDMRFKIWEKV